MKTKVLKSKSPNPAGQRLSEQQHKGNTNSLKYKVFSALKSEKLTAIMLNKRFCFNDARKVISDLRGDGHQIADYRLPDGRKVYFIHHDGQLSIFD